ncbi:MAG: hypothetical protein ABIH68_00760 [bacterium]
MLLMLISACFLLMFLWLDLRVNAIEKVNKDIQFSIPKLLDKISQLRKRLDEAEKFLNIENFKPGEKKL